MQPLAIVTDLLRVPCAKPLRTARPVEQELADGLEDLVFDLLREDPDVLAFVLRDFDRRLPGPVQYRSLRVVVEERIRLTERAQGLDEGELGCDKFNRDVGRPSHRRRLSR